MTIKNYDDAADRQVAVNPTREWEDTARQHTVWLGEGERLIVTHDKQKRIGVVRTDRHGTPIARAQL
jgi:hypothetical protein